LHSKDGIKDRLKESLPSNFLGILCLPYDGGIDLNAEIFEQRLGEGQLQPPLIAWVGKPTR
jgi:hypothetical protein